MQHSLKKQNESATIRVLAALLITTIVGTMVMTGLRVGSKASNLPNGLRYHYEIVSTNMQSYRSEIAFLLQRISIHPKDGLDRAALAATYLRRAKATGEVSYFLLAQQSAEQSLAALPFLNPGAILVLAEVSQAQHDFVGANKWLEQILKTQPRSGSALALRASIALATGELDTASRIAEKLAHAAPNQGNTLFRALLREARGQDAAAEQDFLRAIKLEEPEDLVGSARARTLLARFYARHGRLELAHSLLLESIRIAHEFTQARLFLADTELQMGAYKMAEKNYKHLLYGRDQRTLTTFNHAALRGLAKLAREHPQKQVSQTGLWNEAEQSLRQEVKQGAFGHRRDLAELLLERGNTQSIPEALHLASSELATRHDWQTLGILAWAEFASGQMRAAQTTLQRALRTGVQDAQLYDLAARVELALGKAKHSQEFFAVATKINPNFAAPNYARQNERAARN